MLVTLCAFAEPILRQASFGSASLITCVAAGPLSLDDAAVDSIAGASFSSFLLNWKISSTPLTSAVTTDLVRYQACPDHGSWRETRMHISHRHSHLLRRLPLPLGYRLCITGIAKLDALHAFRPFSFVRFDGVSEVLI